MVTKQQIREQITNVIQKGILTKVLLLFMYWNEEIICRKIQLILEFDFDAAIATIGSPELTPGKVYNLAWLSGNGGGSIPGPSGNIYVDTTSGGLIDYLSTNGTPTNGGTYTTSNNSTGNNIHMQLLPAKATYLLMVLNSGLIVMECSRNVSRQLMKMWL